MNIQAQSFHSGICSEASSVDLEDLDAMVKRVIFDSFPQKVKKVFKEGKDFVIWELSESWNCKIPRTFADQMVARSAEVEAINKKEQRKGDAMIKVPLKLRRIERAYIVNEGKGMLSAEAESMKCESIARLVQAFKTGQRVHWWFANWFPTAEEPPAKIKGSMRPKWYSSSIIKALGIKTVKYAGVVSTEHCYQTY